MRRVSTATASFIAASALAFVAMVGVSLSAQNADAAKLKNPVASTPASIAAGKASYTKYCQFCHGEAAKGDGKMAPPNSHPSDLTDAKWDHGSTDGEIFTNIKAGPTPNDSKAVMKGFSARMTDQQIWEVVDYIRSIGPKK
jgi:mono/diheme cytochrome c family protein